MTSKIKLDRHIGKAICMAWALWLCTITFAQHHFEQAANRPKQSASNTAGAPLVKEERAYDLGYLPVTCHLTCPVTDFISRSMGSPVGFHPQRFTGWPELKEAFLSGRTPAAFILAPMAIALREQGVPLKIVYLGHRDGTATVVHNDSNIRRIEDLKGHTVAIPNRFSNQYLLLYKALADHGMTTDDVKIVEMPPPDMPVAIRTRAVDAATSGEPFMARTEMDGFGRVLYQAKEVWPNFISCVLTVREDLLRSDPRAVKSLVDGIAKSGKWLDETIDHRLEAAEFVGKKYYNQNPELLKFVLSKPPDRVKYTDLNLLREEFAQIERLAKDAGLVKGTAHFDDYADTRFASTTEQAWTWEAKQ